MEKTTHPPPGDWVSPERTPSTVAGRPETPPPPDISTVLGHLQQPNPDVTDIFDGARYGNMTAKHHSFDRIRFGDTNNTTIQNWADFNFAAIELAYGDILHQDIRTQPDYRPVSCLLDSEKREIKTKRDITSLGWRWSTQVVKVPLRMAAAHLRPGSGFRPYLAGRKVEWMKSPDYEGLSHVEPDWTIHDRNTMIKYREEMPWEVPRHLVYVVGDSKLTQKWKSGWLSQTEDDLRTVTMDLSRSSKTTPVMDLRSERLYPLEQVATYCRVAQTRYAFILTQTELVALRIRRIQAPHNEAELYAAVEYAPVSWYKAKGLTVNLAIWALGCMGLNEEHREMETSDGSNQALDKMARLTWWKYDPEKEVFQNVISKRQIKLSEWKNEYYSFVHLTEEDGNSFTRIFYPPPILALASQEPISGGASNS